MAPVTVMSPVLAKLALAVMVSEGTPLVTRSVPLKTAGDEVIPGMVRPADERLIDQLSRLDSVPVKPMVEVTPESVTLTLPRTVIPLSPISADSVWSVRFSRTGSPEPISSPVTAATASDSGLPCSNATSSPSARTASSRSTRAPGSVHA